MPLRPGPQRPGLDTGLQSAWVSPRTPPFPPAPVSQLQTEAHPPPLCRAMSVWDTCLQITVACTLVGGWVGAFPIPLDWDRPWQVGSRLKSPPTLPRSHWGRGDLQVSISDRKTALSRLFFAGLAHFLQPGRHDGLPDRPRRRPRVDSPPPQAAHVQVQVRDAIKKGFLFPIELIIY